MATGFNMSFDIFFKFRRKGGEYKKFVQLFPIALVGGKLNLQSFILYFQNMGQTCWGSRIQGKISFKDTVLLPPSNFGTILNLFDIPPICPAETIFNCGSNRSANLFPQVAKKCNKFEKSHSNTSCTQMVNCGFFSGVIQVWKGQEKYSWSNGHTFFLYREIC